jgi:hypothetical protein
MLFPIQKAFRIEHVIISLVRSHLNLVLILPRRSFNENWSSFLTPYNFIP